MPCELPVIHWPQVLWITNNFFNLILLSESIGPLTFNFVLWIQLLPSCCFASRMQSVIITPKHNYLISYWFSVWEIGKLMACVCVFAHCVFTVSSLTAWVPSPAFYCEISYLSPTVLLSHYSKPAFNNTLLLWYIHGWTKNYTSVLLENFMLCIY